MCSQVPAVLGTGYGFKGVTHFFWQCLYSLLWGAFVRIRCVEVCESNLKHKTLKITKSSCWTTLGRTNGSKCWGHLSFNFTGNKGNSQSSLHYPWWCSSEGEWLCSYNWWENSQVRLNFWSTAVFSGLSFVVQSCYLLQVSSPWYCQISVMSNWILSSWFLKFLEVILSRIHKCQVIYLLIHSLRVHKLG